MAYYLRSDGKRIPYTAYHGFWPKDLFRIDEHFAGPTKWEDTEAGIEGGKEGWDIFRALEEKTNDLNIKLMLDAVINHSNLVDMGEGFNDRGRSFPPGTAGWGENGIFRDKRFVAAAGDYFLNGKKLLTA